ncbi:PH domain-containing protein [Streptomyces sp. ms191]|uniref:PH domain-containing protein n=1 Tax=Streptomyces sp. ms191 TaxID=1827978 RepID=UPI0011CE6742|nr:PH domain-containing protein [Streptomyces sp. ms191]TXS29165.1 PH domain-containing protein [Streptomyces sp. ms191]
MTTGEDAVPGAIRLRPPRNTLNRRAVAWWRTRCLLATAAPVAVLVALAASIGPARSWLLLGAGILAVLGLAGTAFFPRWWFAVHRWEVTDDAVYVRTGAFRQEWRIAPMSRIQTVDTVRGPLEQVFRLATVTVTTASAKGALRIGGLDHELAAELGERLTRITRDTPGDAT